MKNYYQPSGKFSSVSLLYFVLLSAIAFPILGLIYAYSIWYIPFIYINFLIAAGFGFVIGFVINKVVIQRGKVRNNKLAVFLGLLGGVIALYFHWAVWVDLVLNAGESFGNDRLGVTISNINLLQVFSLAADPGTLFSLISQINEAGTWGISGSTVSGLFLSVIWLIELAIIIVVATIIPLPAAKKPFCERSNAWFRETILPAFIYIEDKVKMISDLEMTNSNSFDQLSRADNLEQHHSVFTLYTSDHNENYLSVENKIAKVDKKGKLEYDTHQVVQYISINNPLKEMLLSK